MSNASRMKKLLLANLFHIETMETYRKARRAGLLISRRTSVEYLEPKTIDVTSWVPAPILAELDNAAITRILEADAPWDGIHDKKTIADPEAWPTDDWISAVRSDAEQAAGDQEGGNHKEATDTVISATDTGNANPVGGSKVRSHSDILKLIRGSSGKPPVADLAVALLVAGAFSSAEAEGIDWRKAFKKRAPIVSITAKVKGFEAALASLLEWGGLFPRSYDIACGDGGFAFKNCKHINLKNHSCERLILAFSADSMSEMEPGWLRDQVGKSLKHRAPILILDEVDVGLQRRVSAAVDLTLKAPAFTAEFIAELVELHLQIPAAEFLSFPGVADMAFDQLGLDDLTLGIRTRPLPELIDALRELIDDSAEINKEQEEKADHKKSEQKSKSGSKKGDDNNKSPAVQAADKRNSGALDVIEPEPIPEDKNSGCVMRIETLGGYGQAKQWALDLKQDLDLWRQGHLNWAEMSSKLLLSGPPGTGKTTYARALCNTLQVPLIVTSVATWLEPGYLGDVLKRMKAVFEAAQTFKPTILFIDEIDGIGKRISVSDRYTDYWNSLVNRLLELLDGALKSEGVIVVGATNRPDAIDDAIRRSGRLETHIVIPKPDETALAQILKFHLRDDLTNVLATAPAIAVAPRLGRSSSTEVAETQEAGHTYPASFDPPDNPNPGF